MKFEVIYKVGKSIRTKNIQAKNLDEAEIAANKKFKNWVDIVMVNKKLGKPAHE